MIYWIRNVYLDHNATTPPHPEVTRCVGRTMKNILGNPSSLHTVGRRAKYVLEDSREQIASALGCDSGEVFFTSGGTEGNVTILKGVFAHYNYQGTLIMSALEHESILGAATQLEAQGVRVIRLETNHTGCITSDLILPHLTSDVKLVSVMHGNNETGIINDVENIGKLCREKGILFHVDAVQTFGKIAVNPAQIPCDFLTVSSHKINGPKGCGALYIKDSTMLSPLIYGGDQEHALRSGTENVYAIAGFAKATQLRMSKLIENDQYLLNWRKKFVEGLRAIYPDVKINEGARQLPGTLSLTFPNESNLKLLAALDCYGVEVSIGSACTADRIVPSHVLLGMGYDESYALSTLRVSASSLNSMRDLHYVLKVFREIREEKLDNFAYLMPEHFTQACRERAYVIDVRWPYERMLLKTIPEAHEVNALWFERWSKSVPRDKEIIMICSTGVISGLNGYKLARKGYNVKVVYGGYAALPKS